MAAIALLIIDRFPRYLRYFAETEFRFDGRVLSPRNRLIKTYDGPLGMKTGHLPASGYHLVALAHLGQRRLLSVVMGAHNRDARDRRTRRLLDLRFDMCREKIAFSQSFTGEDRCPEGVPEL
jgi:D-alanyl-D-alanine carboxypeptidase